MSGGGFQWRNVWWGELSGRNCPWEMFGILGEKCARECVEEYLRTLVNTHTQTHTQTWTPFDWLYC